MVLDFVEVLQPDFHECLSEVGKRNTIIETLLKFPESISFTTLRTFLKEQRNPVTAVLDTIAAEFIGDLHRLLLFR
jgi:hypothetical protein